MSEIKFEEPPERRWPVRGRKHAAIAAKLKERPGEWAIVDVSGASRRAGQMALQVRRGRISPYAPAGSFEAMSRTVDGECRVYARYVGEKAAGQPE